MKEAFFAIRDGSKRKAKPCAFMRWTAGGGFRIDIQDDASVDTVPAFFIPFVEKGDLTLGEEMSGQWVGERIPPTGRQNLGEILDAHSLSEYNEVELLRSSRGESSHDSFIVQEIDFVSYEKRRVDKASTRRKALGKAIRERRKNLGMSQRELADELGISQPALSKIEAGRANITFDLLIEIDDCLSEDEPSFLRIPATNLWTRERSEMRRGLEAISPDHAATYENLIDWLEEHEHEKELDDVSLSTLALLLDEYDRSLQSISETFSYTEQESEKLRDFCIGILAEKVSLKSLRNYIVHHGITEFWGECLEAVVLSERFQRDLLSSFAEENYELLLLLATANRVNSIGEYEEPLQEQISRLFELSACHELSSLTVRELNNPHWKRRYVARHPDNDDGQIGDENAQVKSYLIGPDKL